MWLFQFWLHAACSLCETYPYFSLKHGYSTLCYDCLICLLCPNNTVFPWDTFCFSLLWDNKSASCQSCPTAIYGNIDRKRYYCSFTALRRNRYCHSLLILASFSSEQPSRANIVFSQLITRSSCVFLRLKRVIGTYLFAQLCVSVDVSDFLPLVFATDALGSWRVVVKASRKLTVAVLSFYLCREHLLWLKECVILLPGQSVAWHFKSRDQRGCLPAVCSFIRSPDADV